MTRPFSAPFFAAPWVVWLAVGLWRQRTARAVGGVAIFGLRVQAKAKCPDVQMAGG